MTEMRQYWLHLGHKGNGGKDGSAGFKHIWK